MFTALILICYGIKQCKVWGKGRVCCGRKCFVLFSIFAMQDQHFSLAPPQGEMKEMSCVWTSAVSMESIVPGVSILTQFDTNKLLHIQSNFQKWNLQITLKIQLKKMLGNLTFVIWKETGCCCSLRDGFLVVKWDLFGISAMDWGTEVVSLCGHKR